MGRATGWPTPLSPHLLGLADGVNSINPSDPVGSQPENGALAGRKKGAKNADPEKVRSALSEWHRLGTAELAAEATGTVASSLRTWRKRDAELWDELGREHARVVRERHSAKVRQAWDDFAEAAIIAAQKIKAGDYDGAKDFRAYAGTIGDFARSGDHAMRLDAGDPTSIREDRRTDAELLAALDLAAERAGVTLELPEIDPSTVSHTGEERH